MSKNKKNTQQERTETTAFSKSEFYGENRRSQRGQSKKSRKRQRAKYRNNFDQKRPENEINATKVEGYPPIMLTIPPKVAPIVPQND